MDAVIWQVGSAPADMAMGVGVPTVGVIVTALTTCAEGLLHPFAVTWILTVPVKPAVQVITPVDAFIVPAAASLTDQLKPVLALLFVRLTAGHNLQYSHFFEELSI